MPNRASGDDEPLSFLNFARLFDRRNHRLNGALRHFTQRPLDGCEAEGLATRGFLITKSQDGKVLWNAAIKIDGGLEHARCLRVIGDGDQGDIRVL